MHLRRPHFSFTIFPLAFALSAFCLPAHAATPFAVAAANVTMPSSGNGVTQYTVTGIPLAGNLTIACAYSGPVTDARIPSCSYGPAELIPVEQGQTVKGSVYFYPYGSAIPARLPSRRNSPAGGLALAAAMLLGLRFRSRSRSLFAATLLALATLVGFASLSACSGGMNGMTPGTYQYTITAGNTGSVNNLATQTATTISVTVP